MQVGLERRKINQRTRRAVFDKYVGRCAYCGRILQYKDMAVDHIVPLHLGGADDISNYNPSCRSCNRYKSTYTVERFRQQLQCIPARLERDASYCIARRFGLVDVEKTHVGFFFEETEPWKGDPSDDEDRTSHDVSGKGL